MDKEANQSADVHHVLTWVETNRKLLIRVAAAVAILGCIIGFYLWHKSSTEAKAEDALSMLPLPNSMSPATEAAPFAKVADDYPGTKAAARALLLAGGIYFDAEKYEEAKGMFDRYLAEHSDYPLANEAVLGVAACLDAEGKTNDAIAKYEEIIRRPPDQTTEQARAALAHLYAAQNKPEQALRHYEDSLRGNSRDTWEEEGRIMGLELIGKYPNLANQAQNQAAANSPTLETPKP